MEVFLLFPGKELSGLTRKRYVSFSIFTLQIVSFCIFFFLFKTAVLSFTLFILLTAFRLL